MSLSRLQWEQLCQLVYERDLLQAWKVLGWRITWTQWQRHPERACVARFLDPNGSGPCSGRLTFEHVRKHAAMGGPKANDDERHLVALCWHHHLDGWATAHKPMERDYLESIYGPMA